MIDIRKRIEEVSQAVFMGANLRKHFYLMVEIKGWDFAVSDPQGRKFLTDALTALDEARTLILGDED